MLTPRLSAVGWARESLLLVAVEHAAVDRVLPSHVPTGAVERVVEREEGGTVLAVEALRRANATHECRVDEFGMHLDCDLVKGEDFSELFVKFGPTARDVNHSIHASALLDGFSVEEVTAAEEALA